MWEGPSGADSDWGVKVTWGINMLVAWLLLLLLLEAC